MIAFVGDVRGSAADAAPAGGPKDSAGPVVTEAADEAVTRPPAKREATEADGRAPVAPADAEDTADAGATGKEAPKPVPAKPAVVKPAVAKPLPVKPGVGESGVDEAGDPAAIEAAEAEAEAAKAGPLDPDPVQVYGWREMVSVTGVEGKFQAKLDTGAQTSSIHADDKELFERDGRKWVRFVVTDPRTKDSPRTRIEAPLVRIVRIKEPGGESVPREVVRLSIRIGDRKLRAEFSLNNRDNMNCPLLIGRSTLKDLGVVDPGRTYLADRKIIR